MQGYDINSIQDLAQAVAIPVVALGGAGSLAHLHALYQKVNVNGLAAGSIFVFHGIHRGVLIQYPTINQKEVIYADR
jgi:cyclase